MAFILEKSLLLLGKHVERGGYSRYSKVFPPKLAGATPRKVTPIPREHVEQGGYRYSESHRILIISEIESELLGKYNR